MELRKKTLIKEAKSSVAFWSPSKEVFFERCNASDVTQIMRLCK